MSMETAGMSASTAQDELQINLPHWLIATGDADRVEVLRSLQLRETSPRFAPVREYIDRHGLVLATRQTFEDDDWFLCRVEVSVYVPQAAWHVNYAGTVSSA